MLLTSTSLVAAATAMMTGEAAAQAPAGFAPAPTDVVSYVQLSNGSVLVQLANQQSLLVTSNNFFIDGTGVLFLSPAVTTGIAGGGASAVTAPAPVAPLPTPAPLPQPLAPTDPLNIAGDASSGVIFEDTEVASSSGGIMGMITGGPGLFGLGTLGTIAAVGLGGGAILFAANAIRARLQPAEDENSVATVTATDTNIERGSTSESVTYAITDFDGIDESDLVASVQAALDGASTVASIFPSGAEITTERSGSGLFEGTEDTYGSINVTLTGEVADALNVGSFPGPAVTLPTPRAMKSPSTSRSISPTARRVVAAAEAPARWSWIRPTAARTRLLRAVPSCSRRPIPRVTPSPTASRTTPAASGSTATPVWWLSPTLSQLAATPSR